MQKLKLVVKETYGTERIYPESVLGSLMARLIGRKTFSREQVKTLIEIGVLLGFDIEVREELLDLIKNPHVLSKKT